MNIELNKTYVNGKGNKVRIVCIDMKGPYPVLGLRDYTDRQNAVREAGCVFYADGRTPSSINQMRLVSEYVAPDLRWFGMYFDGIGSDNTIKLSMLPKRLQDGAKSKDDARESHSLVGGELGALLVCIDITTGKIVQDK